MIVDGRHITFNKITDGALAGGGSNDFIWATHYDTDVQKISQVCEILKEMYPSHTNMEFEVAETPIISFARSAIRFDNKEDEAEFLMRISD